MPPGAWCAPDYPVAASLDVRATSTRYAPEACLRDVLDICAALHLHRVILIGTSFGGLLSMGLAAARPSLFAAVVLNDMAARIGQERHRIRAGFIGQNNGFADVDAAVAHLRARCCRPFAGG